VALPPVQAVAISLPNARVTVLQPDGTLTDPWRRCLQALVQAGGGNQAIINAILQELAAIEAELTTIAADTATALNAAETALSEANLAEQLAIIGVGDGDANTVDLAGMEQLLLLALAGGDQAGGGAPARSGFGLFAGGLLSAGELLGEAVWGFSITFQSPDTASVAACDYPATASAVLKLVTLVSGVPTAVGTITFAAGSLSGVVAFSASVTIAEGVGLQVIAPNPADATLANVRASINGSAA
jgi:hypothetical protein